MRVVTVMLIWVLMVSCSSKKSTQGDSQIFLAPKQLAELRDKKLEEVSGLAASTTNPGFLWTLNDSGNPAIVYLVDQSLNIKLSCKLKGVRNRDWEDIAVGPGPDITKRYVYVADIGDNNARFQYKYIYRFEEPTFENGSSEITISLFDKIVFRLEGERKDTEAILVHPKTTSIYLVSKRERPVHVYELKLSASVSDTIIAKNITSLPLTQIVAADFSANGEEVVMKNYDNIYYWKLNGRTLAEALQDKPAVLKYTEEPQGEAITFNLEGSGFYTLSEKLKGEKTFLYFYGRAPLNGKVIQK
jgi:hypothetical protein